MQRYTKQISYRDVEGAKEAIDKLSKRIGMNPSEFIRDAVATKVAWELKRLKR